MRKETSQPPCLPVYASLLPGYTSTTLYMPPCIPLVGVPGLYMPPGVGPVLYIEVPVMPTMTLLTLRLKKRGTPRCKVLPSPLRINLLDPRNRPRRAKKPATESHSAQGRLFSPNPSRVALRPPSRLWPALSHPEEERGSPGSWVGFLINVIKSVKPGMAGMTGFD